MDNFKGVLRDMERDLLPDPNDEREVSMTWLRQRMHAHIDQLRAMIEAAPRDEREEK